ncbi:MAG: hypothetical protein ACOVMT_04190 [Caulobacter sp.]|jgi:hypothetical protein
MTFQIDTTGTVMTPRPELPEVGQAWTWDHLTPFAQGYVEALLRHAATFSDLAPETLARIIADCDAFAKQYPGWVHRDGGALFWASRQGGATRWRAYMSEGFPPLTVQLGDDGKVRFA